MIYTFNFYLFFSKSIYLRFAKIIMEKVIETNSSSEKIFSSPAIDDESLAKIDIDEEEESKDKIIKKILELAQERQLLLQKMHNSSQKLNLFMTKSSEKEFFDLLKESKDADVNDFMDLLETIKNKGDGLKQTSKLCTDEILSLKHEIEEKEQLLAELDNLFKETVEKTALHSVQSETGKKFNPKDIKELLLKEENVLKSLREFQFYSIQKKYSLDVTKKEKTNSSEGPLDFAKYEMMCIEIQNNKEIIQSISGEMKKITEKASNIINVLSHLEQKLYLAQEEKVRALHREKLLENELNQMRDKLFAERIKYNKMKHESKELQHRFVLLQHPRLIEDYNKVIQENKNAATELEKLKNTYNQEVKSMKG